MQKSYLLLRHNQQSGPYSLEELTGMSLQKGKDLIWVIGQSAGWSYPEEIASLQPLIEGPASQLATKVEPIILSTPTEKNTPESGEQQPARHIYVSLPVKETCTVATTSTAHALNDAATLSFEERVERMRQRVATVDTPKANDEDPEVEIKYTRSLEDIKAEYAGWLQTQKHKRRLTISKKHVSLGALVVLGAGVIWAGSYLLSRPVLGTTDVATTQVKQSAVGPSYSTASQPAADVASSLPQTYSTKDQPERKQPAIVSRKMVAPRSKQIDVASIQQPVATQKPLATREPSRSSATTAEEKISVAEQLQIDADYITNGKQGKGIGGLAVTLKNTSNQVMKMVAVDVIYYTDGMEPIDRETLYFSDLYPGQILTRNARAHKKAEGAYAKLGLISSEEGQIYYASNK
jgi:hypothetical protein